MFYGSFDQHWIDTKMDKFDLYNQDIIEKVKDFGWEAHAILESPNPVIYCILDTIANKLFDRPEMEVLSWQTMDILREKVQDTIFVNCLDSYLETQEVFEQNEILIRADLKGKANRKKSFDTLKKLFAEYNV